MIFCVFFQLFQKSIISITFLFFFQEKIEKQNATVQSQELEIDSQQKTLAEYEELIDQQIKKISELEAKKTELEAKQAKIDKENKSLKAQLSALKFKVKRWKRQSMKITQKKKSEILHEVLNPFFTKAQIDLFLKGKWKACKSWSEEDIHLAMTIRLMSRKAFTFLREKKILPLPGLSTLKEYFKHFTIEEGYFDSVHRLFKLIAPVLTDKQKIVQLSFDEVHLKKTDLRWEQKTDQIVGPYSTANVMVMRCLFKNLKMPIWFKYGIPEKSGSSQLKKEELLDIIKKLESIDFHVVAVACDSGPSNVGLSNKFNISPDMSWFQNPARDAKLYWFFDVPHLLKLIRNNLQTYSFLLPQREDGTRPEISQEMLSKVKMKCQSEITIDARLRNKQIYDVQNQDKQKVKYAAHYLSEMMSDAIEILFPGEMVHVSEFVRTVAMWFDIMNSKEKTSKRRLNQGYGICLSEQEEILKKFKEMVLKIVVMNPANTKRKAENEKIPLENERIRQSNLTSKRKRKFKQLKEHALQPWQKGAAISSNSMIHLFHDLKQQYPDITYIPTTRLNQDVCENLFSVLREMGRHDNRMGPLASKERLRNYILTGGHHFTSTNANVKETEKMDKLLIAEMTKDLVDESTFTTPKGTCSK